MAAIATITAALSWPDPPVAGASRGRAGNSPQGDTGGPPDEFRFTPQEITAELERAGFELLGQPDFLPRQTFLILRRTR